MLPLSPVVAVEAIETSLSGLGCHFEGRAADFESLEERYLKHFPIGNTNAKKEPLPIIVQGANYSLSGLSISKEKDNRHIPQFLWKLWSQY